MTLISSDLNKITDAIRLSQATVRTIRENLFWAFIYNLIGIPVAAGYSVPHQRLPVESDDSWCRHGHEQCQRGKQQSATETEKIRTHRSDRTGGSTTH